MWDEVVRWPRHRLTAALVAAVGIIQGDDPKGTTGGHGHHKSGTGRPPAGRDTERTPSDGH